MRTIIWVLIVAIGASLISLLFEEGRDWWEEALDYVITFEWLGDLGDFFGGLFEDIEEFSVGGLIFGVASVGLIYGLRKWMLQPFLEHMAPGAALFWGGLTYVICGVVGYLFGKRIFDGD
jgi:hypothetical protein